MLADNDHRQITGRSLPPMIGGLETPCLACGD